ncbi:MAG: YhgE/Pip family protein [Nesterenkonia sp.]
MTFLRLIRSELSRLTDSILPILTVLALAVVPVIYGGIYLYANWDPTGNLEDVDAALVNLDEGADFDGESQTIGDDVAEELTDDASFHWVDVDSVEDAEENVASGDQQFALVIPQDFSAALASPGDFESAEQAQLQVVTNDANNYLLSSIVDSLASEVHASVAAQVGEETADQLLTGFGRIHQQMLKAADGADELTDGASDLDDGLVTLHSGASDLADGAADLDDGVDDLSTGLGDLKEGTGQLDDGAATLSSGADDLSTGASDLSSGLSDLVDGAAAAESGAGELSTGAEDLHTGIGSLTEGAEQVADGNEKLSAASHEASEVIQQFESDAEGRVDETVEQLVAAGVITEDDVASAREALASTAADSQLLDRAEQTRTELTEAQEQIDQLAAGSREVADGAAELESGSSDLADGAASLAEQLPDLTAGAQSAKDGADTLSSGADDLSTGASDLSEGAGAVDSGVDELITGADQLDTGATDLSEGAVSLRDGLSDAQDGSTQLVDGAGELTEQLSSGAEDVPDPEAEERDELSTVMGDPLRVAETAQTEAGSYGAGMAPYFLGLSLWIGALVMIQVLRPVSPRALASNAPSAAIVIGSWLPFLLLSLAQAGLVYSAVVFGLELEPAHPWMSFGLLTATSVAFTALVQGVVTLLGNPGKMLMIVLLVLQLVASGGTYPAETLPDGLYALHRWLPLSYVVDGLRHAIYGGQLTSTTTAAAALVLTAAAGLTIMTVAVQRKKTWSLKRLQPPFAEAA